MLILGVSPGATAGDWTITPSVSVVETFTDNVRQVNRNQDQDPDFITRVLPGISVTGEGGRTALSLNYSYEQVVHALESDLDASHHNLTADGNVELYDRVVFVDGNASISRQVVNPRETTSFTAAGREINRTTVATYGASPYFLHHFGTWLETESRARYEKVDVDSDDASSTTTISETFIASSGRRFSQFLWGVTVDRTKTTFTDRGSRKSSTTDGEVRYVLNRQLSLIGGLGYEDISDPTLGTEPSGLTWKAGFDYRPGPRTSLFFTYGHRFDEPHIEFEGSYLLSERTTINASYTQSVITSQELLARQSQAQNPLFNQCFNAEGEFIGCPGGVLPSQLIALNSFGLQDDTFRQNRFSIGISGTRKRNTFVADAFYETRETEATGITETQFGAIASFSRELSRRTAGNVFLTYTRFDFGDAEDRVDDEITATVGLDYQIVEETTANISYTYHRRFSSEGAGAELSENAVTVSLRKTF